MCLPFLGCLCGPSSCCCCAVCPSFRNSILTRVAYGIILLLTVISASILLSPHIFQAINESFLCNRFVVNIQGATLVNLSNPAKETICGNLFGYITVYRIMFALAIFFAVMALLMICVRSTKDPRSYIQNGFWFFKGLFIFGITIGFFFIPTTQNLVFSRVVMGIGMAGAIVLIVLQVILLVDFAHSWNESWVKKVEDNDNKAWYVGLLIFSCLFYFIAIIGIILMYVFFIRQEGCHANKTFISVNLILNIIVSILSVLPCIRKKQPQSGLLQSSIVSLYTTYLLWSALSNEPYGKDQDCNLGHSTVAGVFSAGGNQVAVSVVGIILIFLTVTYMCFRASSRSEIHKLSGGNADETVDETTILTDGDDGESDGDKKTSNVDDEKEKVTYSYTFFHLLMFLATLYIMVQLTNWYNPVIASSESFGNTWASVAVKMGSAYLCYAVYIWTMIAPLVLVCRDFGYTDE